MNAISVSFGLLVALFVILLLYKILQAETTGRPVRITENVPVLWVDHISIEGMLPGVRSVSYSRERDSDYREIERRSSPHAGGFDRQKSET